MYNSGTRNLSSPLRFQLVHLETLTGWMTLFITTKTLNNLFFNSPLAVRVPRVTQPLFSTISHCDDTVVDDQCWCPEGIVDEKPTSRKGDHESAGKEPWRVKIGHIPQ